MLVLARKLNESICVGDEVRITIVQIRPGRVRLGIDAPPHIRVRREEVRPFDQNGGVEFEVEVEAGAMAW